MLQHSPAAFLVQHNYHLHVQTEAKMTKRLAESEEARDASERMIALGRLGGAHDVARALEFLLHPDSSYITGVLACLVMSVSCAWRLGYQCQAS